MTTQTVPEPLLKTIRSGDRFLLTSHVNPDGDAVGSCLGMARLLRRLGKGATVWLRDPSPAVYARLAGADRIHVGEAPPAGFPERFTSVMVMECPTLDRTGLAEVLAEGELEVLNVDHHLGNEHYGKVNWVDPSAPAVGEMVFRLARALKIELDEETADALYLTLVTDTGGFRFSNTTAEAFDAAADLVRDGASPERVAGWLYESQPESSMRLLGDLLQTLERHDGDGHAKDADGRGRIATGWLTREMYERHGAGPADSEGLIDHIRSIGGVDAVALFRDTEDGGVKASLRSRGEVDVEKIARSFGGGGHQNAAGFRVADGDRDTVVRDTVAALVEALGDG